MFVAEHNAAICFFVGVGLLITAFLIGLIVAVCDKLFPRKHDHDDTSDPRNDEYYICGTRGEKNV